MGVLKQQQQQLQSGPKWNQDSLQHKLREERTSSALTHIKNAQVYTGNSVSCPVSIFSAACSECWTSQNGAWPSSRRVCQHFCYNQEWAPGQPLCTLAQQGLMSAELNRLLLQQH